MTALSELVEDAKLTVRFFPDYVSHEVFDPAVRGTREEKWKRDQFLGRGGFGTVWLERCLDDNDKVRAVKMIPRQSRSTHTTIDFTRELEAMIRFSQRKYARQFVNLFGWYEDIRSTYITMEYFPLGDLQSHLSGPLPETDVQVIVYQVLQGLEHLHNNGFAHRDLKPENIFVVQASPDWWIKIGDLGISKRVNQDTALRTRVGSPGYFAPEIVQQELYGSDTTSVEYTHAVDIWALGVMTHYMLTKLLPFRQLHDLLAYARGGEFPTSSLSEHRIGSEGQNLIQLLMATTPEDRLTVQLASQNAWVRHHLHSGNVEREQTPGETYMLKNSNATNAKPHDPIGAAQSSTSQQIALMGSSSDTSRSWFGSNEWTTQVVATRTLRDMLHSDMGLERSRKPQDIVTFNSTELIRSSSELNEPRSLSQGEEPHGPQDAEKTLEHDTSTEDGGGTASSTGIMSGDTQHVLGIRYFQKGYYEKAELMFSEAYHLRRGRLGLDHKDALSSLYMQAKALLGPRNRRAVGNLIEQHCIAEKDTRGRLGPFTVAVCDELGGLFFAAGAYHEAGMMASLMYEDSARYNNPPPGQGSREHEFCIWKNAMCLFKQGQIPLARIYFTALKHRLEPGPTDIATKKFPFEGGSLRFGCKALFLDALCAFQDCQYVYPEDAFRNIHDYQCKVSGRFHHETLAALHMLGCAYHMQQKYKKAHAVFNEVYTARLETLGEDHKDTTFSAECLAISSQAQHSRLKRHFLNTHVPPIPVVDPTLEWERVPGSRADELVGVL